MTAIPPPLPPPPPQKQQIQTTAPTRPPPLPPMPIATNSKPTSSTMAPPLPPLPPRSQANLAKQLGDLDLTSNAINNNERLIDIDPFGDSFVPTSTNFNKPLPPPRPNHFK